jgi:precorrin-3B C17-methyltransferase
MSAASGRLRIIGLGPGTDVWITPEASQLLAESSDLVGYAPYLARLPDRPGQRRHPSGNGEELFRARIALELAEKGCAVALVSGGDPGVFAMAAAVFEAIEHGEPSWRELDIAVSPGISAMQAAAARIGAPLGQDFCAISLSDNLKPWELVERRLKAAADGDFVIALYNPASAARPNQAFAAFKLLRAHRATDGPVIFARAIGRPDERILITTLEAADPGFADMSTLIIIGSSQTRSIPRASKPPFIYTPRGARIALAGE